MRVTLPTLHSLTWRDWLAFLGRTSRPKCSRCTCTPAIAASCYRSRGTWTASRWNCHAARAYGTAWTFNWTFQGILHDFSTALSNYVCARRVLATLVAALGRLSLICTRPQLYSHHLRLSLRQPAHFIAGQRIQNSSMVTSWIHYRSLNHPISQSHTCGEAKRSRSQAFYCQSSYCYGPTGSPALSVCCLRLLVLGLALGSLHARY